MTMLNKNVWAYFEISKIKLYFDSNNILSIIDINIHKKKPKFFKNKKKRIN